MNVPNLGYIVGKFAQAISPQDDMPIELKYEHFHVPPNVRYVDDQYASINLETYLQEKPQDDKKKKLKTTEEIQNPNKQGTGQLGKMEDINILLKSNPESDEYKEARRRINMNQYDAPVNLEKQGSGDAPDGDLEQLAKNLGYKTQRDFMNDFNSSDYKTRLDLGGKLYETGKRTGDFEYYNLAIAQFGWLADHSSSLNDYVHKRTGFFLDQIYFDSRDFGSGELQEESVVYNLKLNPSNKVLIKRLKEIQGTQ